MVLKKKKTHFFIYVDVCPCEFAGIDVQRCVHPQARVAMYRDVHLVSVHTQ